MMHLCFFRQRPAKSLLSNKHMLALALAIHMNKFISIANKAFPVIRSMCEIRITV